MLRMRLMLPVLPRLPDGATGVLWRAAMRVAAQGPSNTLCSSVITGMGLAPTARGTWTIAMTRFEMSWLLLVES